MKSVRRRQSLFSAYWRSFHANSVSHSLNLSKERTPTQQKAESSKILTPSNHYRNFRLAIVSTCVEATRCKYAPDLEAIEVDISTTASVTNNENIKSGEFMALSRFAGLSARHRTATIMPWVSNRPEKPIRNPTHCF